MLQTNQQFPSIGREKKDLVVNPDTSVDVWFGPTPPKDHEANWVQTVPYKGWNILFRLYGPLQPWFDKSWKPGEFEVVTPADFVATTPIVITEKPAYRYLTVVDECPSVI
jgi:hypothetical protein